MESNILRNFLYLNNQLLDDYLSALEGALFEETIVEKSEKSLEGKGGINIQVAEIRGKKGSIKGIETTKKVNLTDSGKFQRLYEILNIKNGIQYYENMTPEKWNTIERNCILECLVKITFSKLESIVEAAEQMLPFTEMVKQFSNDSIIDDKSLVAIEGLKELGKLNRKNGIPCICSFTNNPEYKIISYLNPEFLKVSKGQMIGELNLFCKVQRKLEDNEKIELFNIVPSVGELNLNREQKRKLKKDLKLPSEFKDTVKSPAVLVIPIAIYT